MIEYIITAIVVTLAYYFIKDYIEMKRIEEKLNFELEERIQRSANNLTNFAEYHNINWAELEKEAKQHD